MHSKSDTARELARQGKTAKEIQKATGLQLKSIYRALRYTDIRAVKPPPRTSTAGTMRVTLRYDKQHGTEGAKANLGIQVLRAAGLDRETRLAYRVVGKHIIVGPLSEKETLCELPVTATCPPP